MALGALSWGRQQLNDHLVSFSGPPPTNQTVTITSSDPTHFLLSSSPTTVSTTSIVIPLPAGVANGSLFYVQGQNFSGTTPITNYLTASAANYLSEQSEAISLYPTALVTGSSAETLISADRQVW